MSQIIKKVDEQLTEEVLDSMIGKYIHATTNELLDREGTIHNVWFAGQVAGYQKSVVKYDYINQAYREEPMLNFHALLTDGMAYTLSNDKLEISELTEDEFLEMVAEHTAKQIAEESIILPDKKDNKILLAGKDF